MSYDQLLKELALIWTQMKVYAIEFLPKLLLALLIFAIGYLTARLLRSVSISLVKRVGDMVPGERLRSRIADDNSRRYSQLIGNIVFWFIMFFFLTAGTEVMGLPIITAWLGGLVQYLPNVLAAVLIIFLGVVGGSMVGDLIVTAAPSAGVSYGEMLGKLVQYAILLISVVIGVEQIGIDIAFLTGLISIIVAAMLFGAALAFGIGARTSISNILAVYYLQQIYKVGQQVRIGQVAGRIVQITATAVIIESEEGLVNIPAKRFSEAASTLINTRRDDA